MKLDHRRLTEAIIILFIIHIPLSVVLSSYISNYSPFVFAQPTCSSSTSKSAMWINIARVDKYESDNITDIGQNSTILKHVPKLAEAIMMADASHEQLKPFANSAIMVIPVSPTVNIIVTDKDMSLLLQSIPFNRTSDVDRAGNTVKDFKAYISYNKNVYLLHIFAMRCTE